MDKKTGEKVTAQRDLALQVVFAQFCDDVFSGSPLPMGPKFIVYGVSTAERERTKNSVSG